MDGGGAAATISRRSFTRNWCYYAYIITYGDGGDAFYLNIKGCYRCDRSKMIFLGL